MEAVVALIRNNKDMSAEEIAVEAMEIAGEMCIYTNLNIVYDVLS